MISRRSGFIRRNNSSRLTRYGATQYIRDLNSSNVQPYMITPDKITEADNILRANRGYAVIPNASQRARNFAGRFLTIPEQLPPLPEVNQFSQTNIVEMTCEFDSSKTESNANVFKIPWSNARATFEIPELLFDAVKWRNAIEVAYKQEFTYKKSASESYNWFRSHRLLILPYNVVDFNSDTQSTFKVDITCDNDNDPSCIYVFNSGDIPVIVFEFLVNQKNPADLEDPSHEEFEQEFPMVFKPSDSASNLEPRYYILPTSSLPKQFPLQTKYEVSAEISTDPPNSGEIHIYWQMSNIYIESYSDELYTLNHYTEDEMTNHLSSPNPLKFTAKGSATVPAQNAQ